jgi:hypothetical protein
MPTLLGSLRPLTLRFAFALTLLVGVVVFAGTPDAFAQTPTRTATPVPTVSATPALVRVAVSPRAAKRQVGQFQNFSVTGFFSDGSTKNYTQKVTYFSSDLSVVYPPNIDGNAGRVEAVGVGTATVFVIEPGTGVNSNASDDSAVMEVVEAPTPTPTSTAPTPTRTHTPIPTATATPMLVTLQISPLQAKRNVGQTQNFSVQGIYSDGSTKNLTQAATYSSSNTSVVQCPNDTTTNKGATLAVGPGVATISAAFAGVTTTATGGDAEFTVVVAPTPTATHTGATPTRTVSPTPTATATPVLVSLALSPQTTKKGIGAFQNFTATGTFSDGSTKNLTQRATYASSDPSVASAPNDPNLGRSRVIAVGVGIATISAVDSVTGIGTDASGGNATFEVVIAPTPTPTNTGVTPTRTRTPTPTATATPVLVSLAISPLSVKKAAGQFQNFIVNGTYSNGDVKNLTQKVDYISSKPSVASAPNDPTIGKSRVLAVAPGVAIISAKDPATGITTPLDESATFTVTQAPTPTPTHTGPTSTGPTGTPTPKASPTPTATPILTKIELKPKTAQKPIGTPQNFSATGTFSDGSTKNVTGRLHYESSDPTIASAPNDPTNPSKVVPLKVGTVTISASDPATGVSSSQSDGDATFTVVQGSGSPHPHATPTPSLPDQTGGNPTTACQRDVRRAARTYVDKKLKTLEKCAGAVSTCVQRKPDDPRCLPAVRGRCAAVLGKLADDEARLTAAVIKRCAGLSASDVLGQDGLAYGDIANSCAARFGRALSDLTSVAQCLAAQHSCGAEALFALERPRAGELLRLADAAPDAEACREDFGGSGAGVGDPKGVGKALERCAQTLVDGGEGLSRTRLGSIGRCVDAVFVCVESASDDPACVAKATQKCEREFGRVQREIAKLTVAAGKRCNGVDFDLLSAPAGANLDAVTPACPSYGIPTVTSVADYVACLVRQHECEVADLVRFESPRAEPLLEQVGRTLVDGTCP